MKISKKIDIKIKAKINKLITENRRPYNITQIENIFSFASSPKILLLRHDKIGDLIVSTSFVRILRKKYPNAQIDILLSKYNISAKKCVEQYISNFWIYTKKITETIKILRQLRLEKYDLVIDLFDNPSVTSGFIIKYTKPTFALGIDKKNSIIYDYTVPMLDRFASNIVERIANLLIVFGINPKNENLDLEYNTEIERQKNTKFRFGINLAGSTESRFWGEENNAKLIEYLKEKYPDAEIRVFATGQYIETAKNLNSKLGNLIIDNCKNFDEFAYEVSLCNFIISPDTSIVHLASAYKIPSVILYIRKPEMNHLPWYPFNSPYIALETPSDTIEDISINQVKESIEKLM